MWLLETRNENWFFFIKEKTGVGMVRFHPEVTVENVDGIKIKVKLNLDNFF